MTKLYRSHLLASIHETAEGLYQAGVLDNPDMQMFNALCLTSETLQPAEQTKTVRYDCPFPR